LPWEGVFDTVMSVDPLFDRLGNLLKSVLHSGESDDDFYGGKESRSGDPDLDAAYDELNDFLNKDLSEAERRERDAKRRAEEEARARPRQERPAGKQGPSHGQYRAPSGPPKGLVDDYKALGIPFGSKLPEVKAAYKRLLKANHPDLHASNPEALKRATHFSAIVNAAYQRIETWLSTGKYEGG